MARTATIGRLLIMWLPLRIDLPLVDGIAGLVGPVRGRTTMAPVPAEAIPEVSVRSAWMAVLSSLTAPPGAAVLMSAWTIPAMWHLVEAAGYRPVPVDLQPGQTAPGLVDVQAATAVCEREGWPIAALLVAHLFGGRHDLTALINWARSQQVSVIEDTAQAYSADGWWGHEAAAATLWSFGTIKTATAGGGAIAVVRDPSLRHRWATVTSAWSIQQRADAGRRLIKTLALHLAGGRGGAEVLVRHRDDLAALVRGFPGPFDADRYRTRPHPGLVRQLARALRHKDPGTVHERARLAAWFRQELGSRVPGYALTDHVGWVVPVRVADPAGCVMALRECGMVAMQPSNMGVVPPQAGHRAIRAEQCHREVIFLPADPGLPLHRRQQAVAIVQADPREPAGVPRAVPSIGISTMNTAKESLCR